MSDGFFGGTMPSEELAPVRTPAGRLEIVHSFDDGLVPIAAGPVLLG
jgi:hypothetical protein